MKAEERLPLQLIVVADSLELIEEYTRGLTQQTFGNNRLIQDAVIQRLELIAEVAKRIPRQLRQPSADAPWDALIEFGDDLSEQYFAIDLGLVWKVVHDDLPLLKRTVRRMLAELPSE